MRYCVAAKRGRDDQTEAKYSMRQAIQQFQAPLPGPAAPAGLVKLIEEPGRAIPGQSLQPMRLARFHREPHLVAMSAELFRLLLHRAQPIRVEFPGVHVDAHSGQGLHARRKPGKPVTERKYRGYIAAI